MSTPNPNIEIHSTTTLHPAVPLHSPTTTPLSILDNNSANFSCCGAIWFFPPSPTLTSTHLRSSFAQTLNAFRPWCGTLSFTSSPNPHGPQAQRYRRIHVTYNTSTDPGVPFSMASCSSRLSTYLPEISARRTSKKAWDPTTLPSAALLPETELAIKKDGSPAPNMVVQFTTFACGSTALSIQITHCLSDAISLSVFANHWATTSRSLLSSSALPSNPVFDPGMLSAHAAGSTDAPQPDGEVVSKARALPLHRYSWYEKVEGQPWPLNVPADLDPSWSLSPADPIPWAQWETSAPVSARVLHFSPAEVSHIYSLATQEKGEKISKHTALLAHIWSRILYARQLPSGAKAYLDLTFGIRPRMSPKLPETFLGSPLMHAAISTTIPSSASTTGELAKTINTTLALFDAQAISNVLHDRAHEICPQRLWAACLGREHVLLTTWVHAGVYDVSFIPDVYPVYVEAVVSPLPIFAWSIGFVGSTELMKNGIDAPL